VFDSIEKTFRQQAFRRVREGLKRLCEISLKRARHAPFPRNTGEVAAARG